MAEEVPLHLLPADNKSGGGEHGSYSTERPSVEKISRHQILVIAVAVLNVLVVNAAIAFLVPFFTRTAMHKMGVVRGTAATLSANFVIGCVFSLATYMEFLSAPVMAKDLATAGSKLMLVLSSFTISCLMLLFSVLDEINDWTTFISLCLIIRFFQGVATAANFVSTYAVTNASLHGKAGLTNGFIRAGAGAGYGIGPALAGILYDWGGFRLALCVAAALQFANTVMLMLAVPGSESEVCSTQMRRTFSYLQLLGIPWVWMVLSAVFLANTTISFIEPSFTIYLRDKFGLPSAYVGYGFFIYAVSFSSVALPLGYYIDEYMRKSHVFLVQVIGLLFCAIGLLLVGPAAFIPVERSLALSYISFIILAIGVLSCLLPAPSEMANTFHRCGLGGPAEMRAPIGGLFQAAAALGYGSGPILGSVVTASLGFKQATQVLGGVCLLYATLFLLVGIVGNTKDMNDLQLRNIARGL